MYRKKDKKPNPLFEQLKFEIFIQNFILQIRKIEEDIQKPSRKSVDIQDPSRKSVDNQDRSRKSVDIQDISRKSVDIHDTSRKSVDIQDSSRKSVDVQKNISKLKSDKKLNPTSAAFENLRPILCKKSEEIRKADAETDKNHEFWLVDKDIIKKQFGNHFQKRGINHPEINEKVFHSKQKRRCSEPNTLINTENRKVIKVINFVAITLGEAASKPSITPARSAQNTFKSKHIDFPQKREYKENRIDFRTEEKMLKVSSLNVFFYFLNNSNQILNLSAEIILTIYTKK